MELAIAVLGVVLGAASVGWQAATHVLTGGRIKVVLRVGAMANDGSTITNRPANITRDMLGNLAEQGFGRPVVAVRVHCTGRQPLSVTSCGLKSPTGLTLDLKTIAVGPPLPHPMAVGDPPAVWALDMHHVAAFVEMCKALPPATGTGTRPARRGIVAVVELGNGQPFTSRDELPI